MTSAADIAAAPRTAPVPRPSAAWALPFGGDPAPTVGPELGDSFDQIADPTDLTGAGARRRGLRALAAAGTELPLRALLDGRLRVVSGHAGDGPVLLLTVDPPAPFKKWPEPPTAIVGPLWYVAYLGIDATAAREALGEHIADGFATGDPRLALTRIGAKGVPLAGELARRYAQDNRGAPARTATPLARASWVGTLLPGLLDELPGGLWVAAGEVIGTAVAATDGRRWAEVCTFDAQGLPVDPRHYLRRLHDTNGLRPPAAIPQERRDALGLGTEVAPPLRADGDGRIPLPSDAGTAALRRDTDPFRPAARGAVSAARPDAATVRLALSAPLTIREVPAPMPTTLAGGWPITREPDAGEDGLLAEAVRFYAYDAGPVVKTALWPAFDGAVVGPALDRLRVHLHDRTVTLLTALMADLGRNKGPTVLREFDPAENLPRGKPLRRQLQGRFAVRALLAPEWRLPAAVNRLADRAASARLPLRRFEDLDPALGELRSMVTRARVESALRASFGDAITDPWGGSAVVARAGREESAAPGGYAALGQQVGLTEKLFDELATTPFLAAHRVSSATRGPLPATVQGGPPFMLHLDVASHVDMILGEVLPAGAVPPEWQRWLTALDTLEGRFLLACADPNAANVGLPWGVALTCVLRAYIVGLIGRTMTTALPVEQVHKEVDGYLGIALWEAFTGRPATNAPGHPDGYLTDPRDRSLLSAISSWQVTDFTGAWSHAVTPHNVVSAKLTEMAKTPLMLLFAPTEKRKRPPVPPVVDAAGQAALRPLFPDSRVPGLRQDDGPLVYAARLSAQGHLFVAGEIVRTATAELGMSATVAAGRKDDGDASALRFPHAPLASSPPASGPGVRGLELIAGSSVWSGCNPPHKTHRDGETFDLRFGPDSFPWLEADQATKADLKASGVGELLGEPQEVILTEAQHSRSSYGPLVLAPLVKALIKEQLTRTHEFLANRNVTRQELDVFADIEATLAGTPHYRFTRSAQQVQTAMVAVLLSGATQVITSSPIAYLRAMRAIRDGLGTPPVSSTDTLLTASALLKPLPPFMPKDHHHHLHVHYCTFSKGWTVDTVSTVDQVVDRFTDLVKLWRNLGINLRPLHDYYESVVVPDPGRDPKLEAMEEERVRLLATLRDIPAPDPAGRQRLHTILAQLTAGSPLIEPGQSETLSLALQEIAAASRFQIKEALLPRRLERARACFVDYPSELRNADVHLIDIDGEGPDIASP